MLRRRKILFVATTICLGLNCYFSLLAPLSIRQRLTNLLSDPAAFSSARVIDRIYAGLQPNENVFLHLENFGSENESSAEEIYYRSCYAAYPRKVFVTAPEAVLNHGGDVLRMQIIPNEEWLDRHRVSRTIAATRSDDGRIAFHSVDRQLK